MTSYLITYDLLKPGQDYSTLHDAIRRLDANVWHGLESVWILQLASNAFQIRDYLRQVIDYNDRLLVIALSPQWASKNLPNLNALHAATGTVPIAA